MILCPYCLEPRDLQRDTDPDRGPVLRCPNEACAGYTIPLQYAQDHDTHRPLPVSLVGLPGHGKTVFIEGLIQEINTLAGRWADSDFYFSWLDEVQMRQAMTRLRTIRDGLLPEGTRTVFQQPQVLRLDHIPRVGGCQLVIYDTGGEAFLDAAVMADAAKYVRNSSAVVLLLSVKPDEEQGGPELVNAMMTVYLQTMSQTGGKTQDQNLIVVLTKGDELARRPDLPASAREALAAPNYSPAGPIWDVLRHSSDDLERWLRSDACGYHNFVNLVRSRFKAVRYCIVSAQGQSADESGLSYSIMPRGVLAPLLWLWRLDRSPVWLEADGGTRELYLDFETAIAEARGRTVRLEAQRYTLPNSLELTDPVTIVGEGRGKTVLLVGGPKYGLKIATPGRVVLRSLSVKRVGSTAGDVIRVSTGGLMLSDAAVSGGRAGDVDGKPYQGHGVQSEKKAQVSAAASEFSKNTGVGLLVREASSARVEESIFVDNGLSGVYLTTSGPAVVRGSTFRGNKSGVTVEKAAASRIEENLCEQNTETGILIRGVVGPDIAVRQNRCVMNTRAGIVIRDRASPEITNNDCEKNGEDGIAFLDTSAGVVTENRSTANARHGFRVADETAPTLEANIAAGNGGCGIAYSNEAAGVARQNECLNNRGDGLRIESAGEAAIDGNIASENAGYGIVATVSAVKAAVSATPEMLKGNRKGAILDERPKTGRWFRK